MEKILKYVGVVALVVAIIALLMPSSSVSLGNKTASFWDAVQGYKVNRTTIVTSGRAATFTGLTLSDSATTSAVIGCVQTTATSSGTTIKLMFNASYVGTTTVNGDTTAAGSVFWDYGTCP